MKTPDDDFRPDLKGRAKEGFEHPKEKPPQLIAQEKNKSELDKWKTPKPELKPNGAAREIIDRRIFAENLNAEAQTVSHQAGLPVPASQNPEKDALMAELGRNEMAQALLEAYAKSASAERDTNFQR